MYVMADLSRKDEPVTTGSTDSETLLCTVTYDKARKLLTISPDFTIDDEHNERCYNVTNGYGIKFNYRVEHVSQGRTSAEVREQREDTRRVSMRLFATRESAFQAFASPRNCDQKDGLSSWKNQSGHSPIAMGVRQCYLLRDVLSCLSNLSVL